ncbi:urease accessory protein UreD [Actinospica sp. MGRD01-02]|uniref:Urease accessory protein UreD n=1 Tax=Actinospica acidithermotolerans TaxID=2828514 RepID=A0A941EL82_9ACTN|nr:urease accessory protein UreD [Actinospica acidithermotolerans]MBR7831129.1 urease accessory protein UreD [Actinospica acidithermotolerans]
MKASARLVAEAREDGRTRLTALADQAPLLLRQTPADADAGAAEVHLVGGAAGPIGGDAVHFDLHLGPGASVRVRSVAASLALPGPQGGESSLDISVRIEAAASLTWEPEPLIAARGARHRTTVNIEMAENARLTWYEQTLLGRHGEAPGSTLTRLRVRRAGRPLLDHTLAIGPHYPGSLGPAVAGSDRASATTLIVDPTWTDVPPAQRVVLDPRDDAHGAIAVLPLDGPAIVINALAPDGLALRRLLDQALCHRL